MNPFAAQIAADMQVLQFDTANGFAISATYKTSPTDAGKTVKIMLKSAQDLGFVSPGQGALFEILTPVADCARPQIHHTFTVGTTVYTVESIGSGNAFFHVLNVSSGHRVNL